MPRISQEQIESALAALVGALAQILIELEVTPARLAQISRTSFVEAAASQATKRGSGKPHIARIAALTGLSRSEVKKIVRSNYQTERPQLDCGPRAVRVLSAWRVYPPFANRGKPRRLPISGASVSFVSLCRMYSGDIPHQVILNELERTSRVRLNKNRTIVSVSASALGSGDNRSAQSLKFAAAFLSSALRDEQILIRRRQHVSTSTSVSAAYVEQAVSGRVNDVLDQLPHLFPRGSGLSKNSVCVYALVAKDSRSRRN
jgi:hypothetical protein